LSVEEMLQEYYKKFPQHKVRDAFKLCDTCNRSASFLKLAFYDHCEGCHYEILEKDGLYYVTVNHIDNMHDLHKHNTPEECQKARRVHEPKRFGSDPAPTTLFYEEVGK
jgi:hypothetical protein